MRKLVEDGGAAVVDSIAFGVVQLNMDGFDRQHLERQW